MPDAFDDMGDARSRAQFQLIVDAAARDGVGIAQEPYDRHDVHFQYALGRILVRNDLPERAEVIERIRGLVPGSAQLAGVEDLPEITVLSSGDLTVPAALDLIDAEFGRGVATPDHILSITPVTNCPAEEPEPVPPMPPYPPPVASGGAGVRIVIPDRGLPDRPPVPAHTWLVGVDGEPDPNVGTGTPRPLGPYAAHGLFAAGVARCAAPDSEVWVSEAFQFAGAGMESFVVANLRRALRREPQIISLSAGNHTRHDVPLQTAQVLIDTELNRPNGPILVAAAGNNGSPRPFYPAASDGVTAVGALAFDQLSRAWFSNHGPWVDVWTLGHGMINAYAYGRYTYHEPPRTGFAVNFGDLARWSGTSFSTPLFAGLVASRMSWAAAHGTTEDAVTAARKLVDTAAGNLVPGAGPALSYDHTNP